MKQRRRFWIPLLETVLVLLMFLAWPATRLGAQTPDASTGAGPRVPVLFQVNDSVVKNKSLPEVSVGIGVGETGDLLVQGKTNDAGQFTAELAPGRYFASFGKRGYIPLANTVIEVAADKPNLVTVTLSLMMEEVGLGAQRRVQIILNWGSGEHQAKDLDAHLLCSRGESLDHIYFSEKNFDVGEHKASLDVDDLDWGGPETITLIEPLPGSYSYWVYNYSGRPARLDASDATVRVIIDDRMAGEYRIASESTSRSWRPFKYVEVDQAGNARLIGFTPAELASRAEFITPFEAAYAGSGNGPDDWIIIVISLIFNGIVIYVIYSVVRRVIRARISRNTPGSA